MSTNLDTKKEKLQMPLHSLNLVMDDIFPYDAGMDLFIKVLGGQTDKPGLGANDGKTDAFFN